MPLFFLFSIFDTPIAPDNFVVSTKVRNYIFECRKRLETMYITYDWISLKFLTADNCCWRHDSDDAHELRIESILLPLKKKKKKKKKKKERKKKECVCKTINYQRVHISRAADGPAQHKPRRGLDCSDTRHTVIRSYFELDKTHAATEPPGGRHLPVTEEYVNEEKEKYSGFFLAKFRVWRG